MVQRDLGATEAASSVDRLADWICNGGLADVEYTRDRHMETSNEAPPGRRQIFARFLQV